MKLNIADNNPGHPGPRLGLGVFSGDVPTASLSLHSETLALLRANVFAHRKSPDFFAVRVTPREGSATPPAHFR